MSLISLGGKAEQHPAAPPLEESADVSSPPSRSGGGLFPQQIPAQSVHSSGGDERRGLRRPRHDALHR